MKLVGKIIRKELKDFGKGKDAEAREELVVTAKLDSESGVRGSLAFAPGDNADDYDLGDAVTVTVEQRQQKLPLGTRRGRNAGAESH